MPLYVMFLPVLVYYALFRYWPIVLSVIVAFKDLRVGGSVASAPWVGLDNFRTIFSDPDLLRVIRNTVEISSLRLGFGFLPPIILAIMFNDMISRRLKQFTQTLVYLPHFFSWVVVFGLVSALFSSQGGMANKIVQMLGQPSRGFLLDGNWFRAILIGSGIWKEMGWGTIIYLGALSTIDPQLYEVAAMDGAGPLQRIRYVTIPGILPVVTFVLCISLGSILFAGGEQIIMFYNRAVYGVADIIDTWVYREGLGRFQLSLGTAMGLFQSVIGMLLILGSNWVSKRLSGRGIW
jgi:putative aldouronate transport system permease protein